MRKHAFFTARRLAIPTLILLFCMCAIGICYAAWAHKLQVNATLSSGDFDIVFGESRLYSVEIVDANGARVGGFTGQGEINCSLNREQKQARFSLERALLLEELAGSNRFLMLRFPMLISDSSTVRAVLPYRADLTQPTDENAEFKPVDARLVVDGNEYALPFGLQDFAQPLYWDVYRQVGWEGDQLIYAIFLKLNNDSLRMLNGPEQLALDMSELPLELEAYVMPTGDWSYGIIQAQIHVNYEFSVPLFIEQAHL